MAGLAVYVYGMAVQRSRCLYSTALVDGGLITMMPSLSPDTKMSVYLFVSDNRDAESVALYLLFSIAVVSCSGMRLLSLSLSRSVSLSLPLSFSWSFRAPACGSLVRALVNRRDRAYDAGRGAAGCSATRWGRLRGRWSLRGATPRTGPARRVSLLYPEGRRAALERERAKKRE